MEIKLEINLQQWMFLKQIFYQNLIFKFVGVAGHPEGSPDISNQGLDLAIKEKNNFQKM